jgi:hypothetical protein
MTFLIAPELNDLTIRVTSNPLRGVGDLSTTLPPHRDHFPLLVEPTALRYIRRSFTRSCHFTYTSGHLAVHEISGVLGRGHFTNRWLSPKTPISFRRTKELVIEEFDGHPLLDDIPIEQFESLESLELVGDVDRLLRIIQPNSNTPNGVPVPFPSLSELRPTTHAGDFPFEVLMEVLRERKQAGYGVKTVRIAGGYGECSKEEASELSKFVDVLMLD